ncbi:hypothetical protein [Ideonella margarita]|uniref:Uncharacterized protein n=1 Tax=Ideonella margarita TaxID=2984191 RepID=A0ABU9C9E9_9BURK
MHAALNRALDRLIEIDQYLLDANCSERSLTHRLAVHLEGEFPQYSVDCEYNRDGFDVKRLQLSERQIRVSDEDLDAVTVFPDIAVHVRGSNAHNLLVIEMKKAAARADLVDYDLQKLHAFKTQLQYVHAVHVVLGYTRAQVLTREVHWQ